jgi:RNA polymerase sigma factor (sigma-70 family)
MADLEGDIRAALQQIKAHGPHSTQASDAWVTITDIVRRIASQMRYASAPSAVIETDDVAASMLVRLQSATLRDRISVARSPTAYLRGMARYVLIDHLRKLEKTVPLESVTATIASEDPATVVLLSPGIAAVGRLLAAIHDLSPAEQKLVRQRFWEGMSVADIARGLGEPYSRVVVRMFRLTRKLRRALESP